jgi:hypothetical protein
MPTRPHIAGRAVLGGVLSAGVAVAALFSLALVFVMCDGDGGSPYAAPLSPRGAACNGVGPLLTLLACLAAVGVTIVGSAWGAHLRRLRWTFVGAAVGLALAGAPLGIMSALSPNCADPNSTATGCESY